MNTSPNKLNDKAIIGNHQVNIAIGIIGMLIASTGNLLNNLTLQKEFYLIGAILLLISSILEKQLFFILLQIIITAGAAVAFIDIAAIYRALLPIILSVGVILYFINRGLLRDKLTFIGCLGIAFLAAGYAITQPIIFFLGAFTLMVYSFGSYRRGITIALLWAILNAVFVITATLAIYHSFANH